MPTSGSLLPGAQEPVTGSNGRIGPPWYRFLARMERLLGRGLTDAGTGLAANGDGALSIADNGVSNAMLRDSLALSVIGRQLDTDGDPQDIQAGADGWVLQRDGNTVVFRLPRSPLYTVATLPRASGVGKGSRAFVSDANATTFATIVAGGGANSVPVYSDGTNWRIG